MFFKVDSIKITEQGQKIIKQAAEGLKNSKDYEIILNGHTDTSGNSDYNLELALKRAEAVKKALVKHGIGADKINVFSFGESDQKEPTKDDTYKRTNRRVEIFVSS